MLRIDAKWFLESPGDRLWVGVANLERHRWDWYREPFSHLENPIPDGERYVTPDGKAIICLLITP